MPATADPARTRWQIRTLAVAALIAGVVVLVALIVEVSSPSPKPKLTGEALAGSLMNEAHSAGLREEGTCQRRAATRWFCDVPDTSGSGGATYAVTVSADNCWTARLTKLYGEHAPTTASGCLG